MRFWLHIPKIFQIIQHNVFDLCAISSGICVFKVVNWVRIMTIFYIVNSIKSLTSLNTAPTLNCKLLIPTTLHQHQHQAPKPWMWIMTVNVYIILHFDVHLMTDVRCIQLCNEEILSRKKTAVDREPYIYYVYNFKWKKN